MLNWEILNVRYIDYNPTQELASNIETTLLLTALKTFIASHFLSSYNPFVSIVATSLLLASAVCINENGFTAPVITHQQIQNIRIIIKSILALGVGLLFRQSKIPFLSNMLMFSVCILPFFSLWTLSKAIELLNFFLQTMTSQKNLFSLMSPKK